MKCGALLAQKLAFRRTIVLKTTLENWLNAQPKPAN
jgi:hypothetical protein